MSINREKILESAYKLFHTQGYNQTSVDDILNASGVGKSNFYYHFKSKEDLGLIVLNLRISNYENDVLLKTLGNSGLKPSRKLKKFYKAVESIHLKSQCETGCPFGNLALEMSNSNENFRTVLSDFFNSWRDAILDCIREGVKSGEFRSDLPAKSIADLVLSHLHGAILMVKTHRSISPLKQGSKTIMNLLKAA